MEKAAARKQVKMKAAEKAPAEALKAPDAQRSPNVKEGGPADISTMDHASGLSGLPTTTGQK